MVTSENVEYKPGDVVLYATIASKETIRVGRIEEIRNIYGLSFEYSSFIIMDLNGSLYHTLGKLIVGHLLTA